jgi:hypothetical protein
LIAYLLRVIYRREVVEVTLSECEIYLFSSLFFLLIITTDPIKKGSSFLAFFSAFLHISDNSYLIILFPFAFFVRLYHAMDLAFDDMSG